MPRDRTEYFREYYLKKRKPLRPPKKKSKYAYESDPEIMNFLKEVSKGKLLDYFFNASDHNKNPTLKKIGKIRLADIDELYKVLEKEKEDVGE